jgi:hypothetical protein
MLALADAAEIRLNGFKLSERPEQRERLLRSQVEFGIAADFNSRTEFAMLPKKSRRKAQKTDSILHCQI